MARAAVTESKQDTKPVLPWDKQLTIGVFNEPGKHRGKGRPLAHIQALATPPAEAIYPKFADKIREEHKAQHREFHILPAVDSARRDMVEATSSYLPQHPNWNVLEAVWLGRAEASALAGYRSYTVFPPALSTCESKDWLTHFRSVFADQWPTRGIITDDASSYKVRRNTFPIHLANGIVGRDHNSNLGDSLALVKSIKGLRATINVAGIQAEQIAQKNMEPLDQDFWSGVLKKIPKDAIIHHTMGRALMIDGQVKYERTEYESLDATTAPLRPLLDAIMEEKRTKPRVLFVDALDSILAPARVFNNVVHHIAPGYKEE